MYFASCPWGMRYSPSGFCKSDANFAKNLFGPIPTDAIKPVRSLICSFTARPTAMGEAYNLPSPEISRNASSSDRGSK